MTLATPHFRVPRLETERRILRRGELELHPDNAREGDIGAISESMRVNGVYGSLLVQAPRGDRTRYRILKGNNSFVSLCQLGEEYFVCDVCDVDDASARAILLADNRTSDLASYNLPDLADLVETHLKETGGLEGTGWDGDDLDELKATLSGQLERMEDEAAPAGESAGTDDVAGDDGLEAEERLPRRFGIRVVGDGGAVQDLELGYGWGVQLRVWKHLGAQLSIERVAGELIGRVVDPRTKNMAVVLGVRDADVLADDLEVLVGPVMRGEFAA